MSKWTNEISNLISASGNIGLAIYGEYLQSLVKDKIIDYQPIMGYISDFAGAAAFTSISFLIIPIMKVDKKIEYQHPTLLGIGWTGMELSHKYFPSPTDTFDPKDIVAYWAGIGLACGINHISKKNKKNNLENKIDIN
jgi:hypothetical protein